MSRKIGSRDLRKRKKRKDAFRKMRKHNGHLIPYVPKRQKTDPLKLWIWQKTPMSRLGRAKWNKYQRPHVRPWVYRPHIRFDINPERIRNKKSIEQIALEVIGYEGEFLIMMFSHGRNRFHIKPIPVCRIVIINTRNGLIAKMTENIKLYRYWFWEKK